jgi:hypothetical protein
MCSKHVRIPVVFIWYIYWVSQWSHTSPPTWTMSHTWIFPRIMSIAWCSAPLGSYSYIPYAKSNVTVPWRSMHRQVSLSSPHPTPSPPPWQQQKQRAMRVGSGVLYLTFLGVTCLCWDIIPLPFQRPSADYSSAVILIWITFWDDYSSHSPLTFYD